MEQPLLGKGVLLLRHFELLVQAGLAVTDHLGDSLLLETIDLVAAHLLPQVLLHRMAVPIDEHVEHGGRLVHVNQDLAAVVAQSSLPLEDVEPVQNIMSLLLAFEANFSKEGT